jgi:acetoacetate decarboxylase
VQRLRRRANYQGLVTVPKATEARLEQAMAAVRYGARPLDGQRNREVEATTATIWSTAVTFVWETDPDAIRAVLPPPLEPSEPLARIRFATVNMGTGIPEFGAGWFGVRARHGSVEGEYPLFMPMTTEQATVGGRETFGEPKKIGAVTIDVDDDHVQARFERMGFVLADVRGKLGAPIDIPARDKVDFYFKCSPSPDGKGFDTEPALVYVRRHEEARGGRAVDGTLTLSDSPLDPLVDIPVGRIVSMQYAQVTTTQHGEVVEHVPADWLLPYLHQRYDDLSVLGKRD